MERCILRHRTGSLTGQEFELSRSGDSVLGRDPSVAVRFDGEDDLVSRRHARVGLDSQGRHVVEDLQSRNGTYVNRQRVAGTVALAHGDVIQLGPGGPEVVFLLDPPPVEGVTRLAGTAMAAIAPTVTAASGPAVQAVHVPQSRGAANGVGRRTIERLIGDMHGATHRRLYQIGAALAVLLILGGGSAWYGVKGWQQRVAADVDRTRTIVDRSAGGMTPAQIASAYAPSTVQIEFGWKLSYTPTGEQVYVQQLVETDDRGRPVRDGNGNLNAVPIYLRLPNGSLEPALTLDKGKYGENLVVGQSSSRGSGFVVTADGFILTNGHVAASWNHENFWRTLGKGVVMDVQSGKIVGQVDGIPKWIPTASTMLGNRPVEGRNLAGRHDYLDVVFAHKNLRVPAKLTRESNNHDVALIKIDVTEALTPIPLYDNLDAVAAGSPITVMGFPAISSDPVAVSRSQDPLAREDRVATVPDPTVTPGVVSRVYRATPATGVNQADFGSTGERLQLTANPGGGNSGGPLFDDRGRAVGVFYAGFSGPEYGFAVPIRYGMELLGTGRTLTR